MRFTALTLLLAFAASGVAAPPTPSPTLPRYQVEVSLEPERQVANFRMRVNWTNRSHNPTDKLVFNYYPHYHIPDGEYLLLAKTLELLRLNPNNGIDPVGGHGQLSSITLVKPGGKQDANPTALSYRYRVDQPTILFVELPHTVKPGESVTVELVGSIKLPPKQGRWGQWNGITYLTNALPVVAYHDDDGWKEVPFVPWHQPFWNEAGIYTATVTVPRDHHIACSAIQKAEGELANGRKRVEFEPFVGRDFAIVSSPNYREYRSKVKLPDGREVTLKCAAFEKHEFFAKEMLRIVGEAIPIYSQWFGNFPYDQFTIAESYFGWNGNECSGLILIDERVFAMPKMGVGYAEYLVSHETCHQWWYNLVGTNGYSETFLDEGAATYFTHRLMDVKLGKGNALIKWPEVVNWLPDIQRTNYRFAAYYGAIRRNDAPAAAGDLPSFGHLFGLFSGAYDRGSKALGLIEAKLGEDAFFDFIRGLVKKYSFEVLTAAMLKKELEAYTGQPWDEFFQKWIYDNKLTDWQLVDVQLGREHKQLDWALPGVMPNVKSGRHVVEVVVRQKGQLNEPTTVGFQFKDGEGFPVRIPVGPVKERLQLAEYNAEVIPREDGSTVVRAHFDQEPTQIVIDPDRVLLDANPADNQWKNPPAVKLVPLYTLLNETDLTNDWDRWNFAAGPWAWGPSYSDPWYTRSTMLGVRAGAFRTQTFAGGVYVAARSDYRDLVLGADALFDHWPFPRTQVGMNFEQRIAGPFFGTNGAESPTRAAVYGRYIFNYGSSLYLPPMSFVDLFTTYQDNFLPFARTTNPGGVRPSWTQLTGVRYRLNLYTPYWDPDRGIWIDATVSGGVADLGPTVGTAQAKAELAATHKLPDGLGYLSNVKAAGRVVVNGAFPDRGQFFALGGSTLFRGFDLAERQGSFLWVANAELRLPIIREVEWDVADHVAGLRNLSVAPFYDVGAVYDNGHVVGNVAHAVGIGLRADLAIFSFIERATVRFDFAKTINASSPFQFWFGVQHPF